MNEAETIIACPTCHRALRLPAVAFGQVVRCPVCGQTFSPDKASLWTPRPGSVLPSEEEIDACRSAAEAALVPSEWFRYDCGANRDGTEHCPICEATVPPDRDECPKCHVEFLPRHETEERPWDGPGGQRRDRLPHRGGLLLTLASVSALVPLLALCTCFLVVLFGFIGIGLGVGTVYAARSDLRRMREGIMETTGRRATITAMVLGIIGVVLNALTMVPILGLLIAGWL
jgi:hypothetical protein